MNDDESMTTTVVVEHRSFEVTARRRSAESSVITVVADGREQWTFQVAAWRAWSCGASWGVFYVWTARKLIVFPRSTSAAIEIEVDEDMLLVFKIDLGWLVVCEASVRLLGDRGELGRIECGDVVETARWDSGRLVVLEQSGGRIAAAVRGGQLVAEAVEGY